MTRDELRACFWWCGIGIVAFACGMIWGLNASVLVVGASMMFHAAIDRILN